MAGGSHASRTSDAEATAAGEGQDEGEGAARMGSGAGPAMRSITSGGGTVYVEGLIFLIQIFLYVLLKMNGKKIGNRKLLGGLRSSE